MPQLNVLLILHIPKYLNNFKCFVIPNLELVLKMSVHVILLRNIDQRYSLCNGTRFIIVELTNHDLKAKAISGSVVGVVGDIVYIPRYS